MRIIDKKLYNIPSSLKVDPKSILCNPAKTTNERRLQIISEKKYPEAAISSRYDARYKMSDIKEHLELIYKRKCAYCDAFVEQIVVEHYRPKRGGYYWLAYSWDNLLLACPNCNEYKGDAFPVMLNRVAYDSRRDTIDKINQLGPVYDELEYPLIVNPERALSSEIESVRYDKEGQVFSDDPRMHFTIIVCKLYRKSLCARRKRIWDDLRKEIAGAVLKAGNDRENLRVRLDQVISSFYLNSMDSSNDFMAYRQFILKNSIWIYDWVKELIGQ